MSVDALPRHVTPAERPRLAGLLALLVHVLFLGLMMFAVNWQTRPVPVVAEIWDALPGPETPPAPAPEPAPTPEPPRPVEPPPPPPAPAPVPKPQPAPEPAKKAAPVPEPRAEKAPDTRADIALEKKRRESQRLAEVEARHKRELAEAARRDEEMRREAEAAKSAALAAEQQRQREAEAAQAAQAAAEQQRQRDAQAAQASAQQARARSLDIYRAQIMRAVRGRLVAPPGVQGNPQAEVKVLQLPNGEVVSAKLSRSSGDPAFDAAVERAVLAASPLPLPADRSLFSRDLVLQFRLLE